MISWCFMYQWTKELFDESGEFIPDIKYYYAEAKKQVVSITRVRMSTCEAVALRELVIQSYQDNERIQNDVNLSYDKKLMHGFDAGNEARVRFLLSYYGYDIMRENLKFSRFQIDAAHHGRDLANEYFSRIQDETHLI